MRSRASEVAAAACVLAVGLAGCGLGGGPGLGIEQLQSNVAFGSPTAASKPASMPGLPGQSIAPAAPAQPPTASNPFPAFQFTPPPTFNFSPPPVTATAECPVAPPSAEAARAVTPTVPSKPATGWYKWQLLTYKRTGTGTTALAGASYTAYHLENVSATSTVPNPQDRSHPTTVWTYQMVEPDGSGNVWTYTFQVKQSSPGASVATGNVGKSQSVMEPDAGLAISSEIERNAKGAVVFRFSPQPAVLLLPLAVTGGQSFQGGGTDPSNGESLVVQAQVQGTKRVDACGQLVDGWDVSGTETSTDPSTGGSVTTDVDYAVATQYGAIVVLLSSTPTTGTNPDTATEEMGQLHPSKSPPQGAT